MRFPAGRVGTVAGRAQTIDLSRAYSLIRGVAVIARSPTAVQIGSEPPRCVVVQNAPPNTVDILRRLNGTTPVRQILQQYSGDARIWGPLLSQLRDIHLLVRAEQWSFPGVQPGPYLEAERDSLVHRHGVEVARQVLRARRDAVVVVRGSGRVATAVATSLAVAGLGHVHQEPDRPLRLADLPSADGGARPTRDPYGPAGRTAVAGGSSGSAQRRVRNDPGPPPTDAALLAANLRRLAPNVQVHRPAAHLKVALMVLAGDGPPAQSLAAELTGRRIPHLAVRAGLTTAVAGPFVLPGRSSCLLCASRLRTELDAERPALDPADPAGLIVPPTALVCVAAAMAVGDALDHIDGTAVPGTVDGTLEWRLGELGPRRRSWAVHPDCGCTALATPTRIR